MHHTIAEKKLSEVETLKSFKNALFVNKFPPSTNSFFGFLAENKKNITKNNSNIYTVQNIVFIINMTLKVFRNYVSYIENLKRYT